MNDLSKNSESIPPQNESLTQGYPFLPILFALVFLLYALTSQTGFFWGDPVDEVRAAVSTPDHLLSQHLISSRVNGAILSLIALFGNPAPFFILQLVMSLTTLAGAWGVFLLLRRRNVEPVVTFGIIGIYLLANAVWFHAVTVETGGIPLALLSWSLYWLLRSNLPSRTELAISFGFISISVLFNLQQAIFIPLFFLYAILRLRTSPGLMKSLATIIISVLLTGVLPYLLIAYGHYGFSSVGEFVAWVTYHQNAEAIGKMQGFNIESITRSLAGFFGLVINPQGASSWLKFRMRGNSEVGMNYLFILRLLLPGLILALLGVGVFRASSGNRHLVLLSLAAVLVTFLFGFLWLGSDPQFWLPIWPLLLVPAAIGFSEQVRRRTGFQKIAVGVIAILLPLLAVLNIPRTSPSLMFPDGDSEFQSAQEFAEMVQKKDMVISPGEGGASTCSRCVPMSGLSTSHLIPWGGCAPKGKHLSVSCKSRLNAPSVQEKRSTSREGSTILMFSGTVPGKDSA